MTKMLTVLVLVLTGISMSGCVAAYVGGKAVGAAVSVTTGTVGIAVGTVRTIGSVVTGGDDCDDDEDEGCED